MFGRVAAVFPVEMYVYVLSLRYTCADMCYRLELEVHEVHVHVYVVQYTYKIIILYTVQMGAMETNKHTCIQLCMLVLAFLFFSRLQQKSFAIEVHFIYECLSVSDMYMYVCIAYHFSLDLIIILHPSNPPSIPDYPPSCAHLYMYIIPCN